MMRPIQIGKVWFRCTQFHWQKILAIGPPRFKSVAKKKTLSKRPGTWLNRGTSDRCTGKQKSNSVVGIPTVWLC